MKTVNFKATLFSVLTMLFMSGLFFSCSKDDEGGSTNTYPKDVTIEYKCTISSGTPNKVEIYFTNESGGTEKLTNVVLPFSKKISRTVKAYDGASVSFSAFGPGGIKGEVYVDGKLVNTKTASSNSESSSFNDIVSYIWR